MRETGRLFLALAAVGILLLLSTALFACARATSTEAADTDAEETMVEDVETTGSEDADTIAGTESNDTLNGTEGADKLDGRGGDDEINGLAGADEIDGGTGNDTIRSGPYDAEEDTVEGGDGDDTLLTFDLPAARDVVGCGVGTDDVVADSLDEVADDCEEVEKMQETEPNIADGTYELVPTPSSECSLGRGTLTVGVDPATGQRGVEVQFEERRAPQGVVEACSPRVDYETPVTAQGEPAAQETGRRSYKGKKPSQQEIDEVIKGAQNGQGESVSPAEP